MMGFAGALAGAGNGITDWARERQKLAADLLKMDKDQAHRTALRQQERDMDREDQNARAERLGNVYGGGNGFGRPDGTYRGSNPDASDPRRGSFATGPNQSGPDFIRYTNQNAIRNDPLSGELVNAMSFLSDMGITMEVFSGGQENNTTQGTGSTRHNNGNAADVFFYKDGRKLDWSKKEDLPIFTEIVRRAKQNGITGVGAGPGYMRPGSMHIGFGDEAVWGKDGKGKNAPSWLKDAWNLIADPDIPSSVKQDILEKVKGDKPAEMTGQTWVRQSDGSEVLMGRKGSTGVMEPYTDAKGKPVTRSAPSEPDAKTSFVGTTWVRQDDGSEVLMGRKSGSNQMTPYLDESGQPITRAPERKEADDKKPKRELKSEFWLKGEDGSEVLMGRTSEGTVVPYLGLDGQPITRSRKTRELSPQDRDDLSRMYKSAFDPDGFDPVPTEAQFLSYVESSRKDGESLVKAADRAIKEWTVSDVRTKEMVARTGLAGLLVGGTKEVETTTRRGGFNKPTEANPETIQMLDQARQAIAQGADREAVIQRLKDMGVDPEGL